MSTISRPLARSIAWRLSLKPATVFGGFLVCVLVLRAVSAFYYMQGEVDWGAYLLSVKAVQGLDVTHADRLRPLLGPGWLLFPFVKLLGDHTGLVLWEIVFSFTPFYPLWLLCRRWFSGWQTVGILMFFSMDLILAEMFVTGVLPIIGFSLITLAVWALFRIADRWRWRDALVIIGALGLTAHTNQTSAGLALIAIPTVIIGRFAFSKDWPALKRMLYAVAMAGILTLTALPWYGEVRPGNPTLRFPGPLVAAGGPQTFDWWKAYAGFFFAGLLFWHTRRQSSPALKTMALLLCVTSFLRMFMSHDEALMNICYRSQHLTSFVIYPVIAWVVFHGWMPRLRWHRAIYWALAAYVFIMLSFGFIHNVALQSYYSRMVSDDTLKAIEYMNTHPDGGMTVSTNSNSLGLYVSALTDHKTTWVSIEHPPPAWETFHFDNLCIWDMVQCDVETALKRTPTGYVLLEENWWYERTFWGPAKAEIGRIYGITEFPYPWWKAETAPWIEPIGKWGTVFLGRVKEDYHGPF